MKALVVVKHTAYERRIQDPKIQALLEAKDEAVGSLLSSHNQHMASVDVVLRGLKEYGIEPTVIEGAGTKFDQVGFDIIVTIGGDGTVLAASHSCSGSIPIMAINSAPNTSVGFFCAGHSRHIRRLLDAYVANASKLAWLHRMEVILNGRVVSSRVLNEALVCDACPAATSRYIVHYRDLVEEQRSSGFWLSTAAGHTGAVLSAGGEEMALDSSDLQLVVREPYTPRGGTFKLSKGFVRNGEEFMVRNKMADGRLYLDGSHEVVNLEIGDTLIFRRAVHPLALVRPEPVPG